MWLPEAGGPVDLDDPMHQALVTVLGAQSQREVLRSRHRVLAAMRTQAREQGRYLGGRPPYGVRVPARGRRATPEPNTRRVGTAAAAPGPGSGDGAARPLDVRAAIGGLSRSVASIARELTKQGVPSPSDADPERNRHRTGGAWRLRTVAVILANPRYTGRQVWDRQHEVHGETIGSAPARGSVVSAATAHPALVSEADFLAAQQVRAARPTLDGETRRYLLSGLVQCAVCGRRLDSHWVHDRAGYRCRHGHSSACPPAPGQPKTVYVREGRLIHELADRLASDPGDAAGTVATLRRLRSLITHDGTKWIFTPA
ncbi:hypothetical protein GCM10010210_37750 [Pseudonocardia hydrocarbonoxydans]|uniref:Recombinase domain-containing protein n=1 Tax=Pseudonocardia hydrocarbonoxydans TaxID=76726 RepID=A0A4Y3WJ21_9PSEU|nr:hypothetical protein PHY01_12250 [Pseudonocardia hydrocarbonoxydans]